MSETKVLYLGVEYILDFEKWELTPVDAKNKAVNIDDVKYGEIDGFPELYERYEREKKGSEKFKRG